MAFSTVFLLLGFTTLLKVCGTKSVTALYGETIVIPCNNGLPPPEELMFVKWKYEKDDGVAGDLLIKQAHSEQATVQATDDYASRVSIDDKFSLHISQAKLKDQKNFTCMVVSSTNLMEYRTLVAIYKKPSSVDVIDKSDALHIDKPTTVGTCIAADANPAASFIWTKNKQSLLPDGKAIVITSSESMDPSTGLHTTSSTLQYTATSTDIGVYPVFSCVSTHTLGNETTDLGPFAVHYSPKQVKLKVLAKAFITEGDNVVLNCKADGYPPPSSFFFHIKDQKKLVQNSDNYTLTAISREDTGKYGCSLVDNNNIEDFQNISVNYLDLSLNVNGSIVKTFGDTLNVSVKKSASGDHTTTWTKNGKVIKQPHFTSLTYSDSGLYKCEISMTSLTRHQEFELIVQGKPVITSLSKNVNHAQNDLICEAHGVPAPQFKWDIEIVKEESSYINGKATNRITVNPMINKTVSCRVHNSLGEDVKNISVSPVVKEGTEKRDSLESDDHSKVIVGVVVGLIALAALAGLVYWIYMKNTRQGSFKTSEKEEGTSKEKMKLAEDANNTV